MSINHQLTIRQSVISICRQFFLNKGFTEITIPILSSSIPNEPNIYPFTTKWTPSQGKTKKYFLATSPETYLKKMISQGIGNCFAISPSFRNLENIGPHHHPEFLMLEWYEIGKNYLDIIATTKKLLKKIGFKNFQNLSLKQSFKPYPDNEPDFNQQFLNQVEPQLPTDPTFITDYPAYLSPLAKSKKRDAVTIFSERSDRPATAEPEGSEYRKKFVTSQSLAERFELYINRVEIANGCTENLNPKISVPWGKIPYSAGCGLGLDRLAMVLAKGDSLTHYSP